MMIIGGKFYAAQSTKVERYSCSSRRCLCDKRLCKWSYVLSWRVSISKHEKNSVSVSELSTERSHLICPQRSIKVVQHSFEMKLCTSGHVAQVPLISEMTIAV